MKFINKAILVALTLFSYTSLVAKTYPFDINRTYEITQVRVAQLGTKFIKVTTLAGSTDKAILLAKEDAIAAAIFEGYDANIQSGVSTATPPLIKEGKAVYYERKKFFDTFFKKGGFLNYVKVVNSCYPSGEDNIKTPKGRKVTVYLVVDRDSLREFLEKEKIIKSFNDILKIK